MGLFSLDPTFVKPKHQRLLFILGGLGVLSLVAFFTLTSLYESLIFFYTPSDLIHTYVHREHPIRVGGLVALQSVKIEGETVHFKITDQKEMLHVTYKGVLPDLFREGQGVVAEGYLEGPGFFKADSILAKHDEKYMPKEVANQMKKEGCVLRNATALN